MQKSISAGLGRIILYFLVPLLRHRISAGFNIVPHREMALLSQGEKRPIFSSASSKVLDERKENEKALRGLPFEILGDTRSARITTLLEKNETVSANRINDVGG
ncbi:hypothetical protein GWI33_004528 [Rhynchophorus ferrugineus]|uniref:Uncharacterized protein n=1 Tax=Rhynchophorus ferrugineus TaxID=354439 RepID=A0A834IP98_RHYFE|nr:hypothetical protein GWI33_004528 [Rhynchophorus ferrugineus]